MEFYKARVLSLREHPELSEKWLQERLSEDPSLLGLGDLIVKDVERRHSHAGRLDLLLADPETLTRYEVEIQLGATNESHIIRTIEYWDTERRRYPQYEHIGVLVAEDVTSRFLNVMGLFNGFIPIMAIQLQALEVDGRLTLSASTVVDVMTLGTDEEDESGGGADRAYWLTKAPVGLAITDELLTLVHEVDPKATLKYNKAFIGLSHDGVANNYVSFSPRQKHLVFGVRIKRSDELTERIAEEGLDVMTAGIRDSRYRLRVTEEDVLRHRAFLSELIRRANGSETPQVDDNEA